MYLEVVNVVERESETNKVPYARVTFRPVAEYLANGKAIFSGDSADRLYNIGKEPQIGDTFKGVIHKNVPTTNYQIDDKTVNKTTVVVMDNETLLEQGNAQLKSKNACILVNGKPTVEFKIAEPATENVKDTETVD